MRRRPSLARQITLAVVAYAVLLSIALFVHGVLVNETAERMVWKTLLDTQLTEILERQHTQPGYEWRNNGRFDLYACLEHCTGAFAEREIEQRFNSARHGAKHPGLAFAGGFAVDRLIDVQAHAGDAGANHRQRNRPAYSGHRAEHLEAGAQIADPQFFTQIAVGRQRQAGFGEHCVAGGVT